MSAEIARLEVAAGLHQARMAEAAKGAHPLCNLSAMTYSDAACAVMASMLDSGPFQLQAVAAAREAALLAPMPPSLAEQRQLEMLEVSLPVDRGDYSKPPGSSVSPRIASCFDTVL